MGVVLIGFWGFYFEPTYILVLVGAIFCLLSGAVVSSTMKKYHENRIRSGISGGQCARRLLDSEGLYHVQVECVNGSGDHYDPASQTIRLSARNFSDSSVTAVSVAAHECGHAIQHAKGYVPLRFRTSLVPIVNIGSTLSWPIIILGIVLSYNQTLIEIGIWAFSLAVLFQLITLPVEFNASNRAVEKLEQFGILDMEEKRGSKKVLRAAAFTYVAAAAASVLQLLRLLLLFGGNRRRD